MKKKEREIKQEEIFYVGLKQPVELRRNVLESSKDAIQLMQRYEKLRELRKSKEDGMLKLKDDIDNIRKAVRKLKSVLPKAGIRAKALEGLGKKEEVQPEVKVEEEKPKKARVKKEKIEAPKRELSEIEKLEMELGKIEQKLGKL